MTLWVGIPFLQNTPPQRRVSPTYCMKAPGIKLGIKIDNHGHQKIQPPNFDV
jgi:hypothetical protein